MSEDNLPLHMNQKDTPAWYTAWCDDNEIVTLCEEDPIAPADVKGICLFYRGNIFLSPKQRWRLAVYAAYLYRRQLRRDEP